MGDVLQKVVSAEPDAVQVTIGQARLLQNASGKIPSLVVRTDAANIYGTRAPPLPFCDLQHPDIVLQALQMDACGVFLMLFLSCLFTQAAVSCLKLFHDAETNFQP